MSTTPENEVFHLLRGLQRQWTREVRAAERAKVKEKLAAHYQKGLRDGRARYERFVEETERRNAEAEAKRERRVDHAVPEAYARGVRDGRAEAFAETLQRLEVKPGDCLVLKTAKSDPETADAIAEGLHRLHPEALGKVMVVQLESGADLQVLPDAAAVARMTDALRRARAHLAHPAPDGIWSLARLLDSILVELPPLVLKMPEAQMSPEKVRAIREQFDALKGKGVFHDVLVLDQPAIEQQAAEFIERLDASLAADALDPAAMSNAEVAAELRAAGADPERIGREGAALVQELAAKLPADDPRRAFVPGPEQPLPATVLSVQVLDGPSGSVLVPCEERVHLAVENLVMPPGPVTPSPFTGAEPVGSTIEVDLDVAARSGAFEAAIDQARPEPVVVRDDEAPPEE